MGGSTQGPTQTTNQTQNTQTNPWAPAIPLLQGMIGNVGGLNPAVTPEQSQGVSQLLSAIQAIPQTGPQALGAINTLYGANTTPQQGLLASAFNQLQNTVSPFTNPANLNPYNTPGFSTALNTTQQDITNQIKGMFANAGREFSPDEAQALARGISQGVSPMIASQYNTNVGNLMNAAQQQFGGAGSTASGITAQQSQQYSDLLNAIQASGALPSLYTTPQQMYLQAAQTAQGIPVSNLGAIEQLALPFGALGGTQYGTGQSTTTTTEPLLNTIMGGIGLGLGTAGAFMKSDVRAKTDVRPIGLLYDSPAPVYAFKYRDDPTRTTHIGLLAQDVEKYRPEAVTEDASGTKYVNYDLATRPAASEAVN